MSHFSLRQRDLEFIETVVAALVDARRLAGRPDEHAREQIGQRGMPLPVEHEALQQVGTAQERRVLRRGSAEYDMVAAARAGVASVGQVFVGAKPRLARFLVDRHRVRNRFGPAGGGMNIHLDHAGVGRDFHDLDARVLRRAVALDAHRRVVGARRLLDRRDQLEVGLGGGQRRHEHVEDAVAGLDAKGGAHRRVPRRRARFVTGARLPPGGRAGPWLLQ